MVKQGEVYELQSGRKVIILSDPSQRPESDKDEESSILVTTVYTSEEEIPEDANVFRYDSDTIIDLSLEDNSIPWLDVEDPFWEQYNKLIDTIPDPGVEEIIRIYSDNWDNKSLDTIPETIEEEIIDDSESVEYSSDVEDSDYSEEE